MLNHNIEFRIKFLHVSEMYVFVVDIKLYAILYNIVLRKYAQDKVFAT